MSSVYTAAELITPEVLSKVLGFDVESIELKSMGGDGGLSGAVLNRLVVTKKAPAGAAGDASAAAAPASAEVVSYVMKTEGANKDRCRIMGLAREALFYSTFAPALRAEGVSLPDVHYAHGDMATGSKLLLLEDLKSAVQSGYYFGPGSPHNWGKDLAALTATSSGEPPISAVDLTAHAFRIAAAMHANHWMNPKLMHDDTYAFLRASEWFRGSGQESFMAAQAQAQKSWEGIRAKISSADESAGSDKAEVVEVGGVRWSRRMIALLDASFGKISWEGFQARIKSHAWTLTHSDFHPGNMMWQAPAVAGTQGRLVLLDWEVVGFGSGPQDCAQYVISHMNPQLRRDNEQRLVREYYTRLTAGAKAANPDASASASASASDSGAGAGADTGADAAKPGLSLSEYTFEQCFADYVSGGTERWVWFLGLLGTMCPPPMVQYFHDQLLAFVTDHGVTAETVGMPRV